jgi:hypothetical protein
VSNPDAEIRGEAAAANRLYRPRPPEKQKPARRWERISSDLFSAAALILQQKTCFSLNDSHAFNRLEAAYRQHWQQDTATRWNFCKKSPSISLDVLRCHIAFLFVLCPSVCVQ